MLTYRYNLINEEEIETEFDCFALRIAKQVARAKQEMAVETHLSPATHKSKLQFPC